jgi:hypothetical protein
MPNGPNGEQRRRHDDTWSIHIPGYALAVIVSASGGWFGGAKLVQDNGIPSRPAGIEHTKLTRGEFLQWVTANTDRLVRIEKSVDAAVQFRELEPMIKRLDRIESLLDQLIKERREAAK